MSENLNDIFTDEASNIPANSEAESEEADDGIIVTIVNDWLMRRACYMVYPELSMKDIVDACKDELCINPVSDYSNIYYCYNDKIETNLDLTVEEIGLKPNSRIFLYSRCTCCP